MELKALGQVERTYKGLETIERPMCVTAVTLDTKEVSALCPVTGQPDWYRVRVDYEPAGRLVESKTFKLFVQSFRNEGIFAEALASRILIEFCRAVDPLACTVTVTQRRRGGVALTATARQLNA